MKMTAREQEIINSALDEENTDLLDTYEYDMVIDMADKDVGDEISERQAQFLFRIGEKLEEAQETPPS